MRNARGYKPASWCSEVNIPFPAIRLCSAFGGLLASGECLSEKFLALRSGANYDRAPRHPEDRQHRLVDTMAIDLLD